MTTRISLVVRTHMASSGAQLQVALAVPREDAKGVRTQLEELGLYDLSRKIAPSAAASHAGRLLVPALGGLLKNKDAQSDGDSWLWRGYPVVQGEDMPKSRHTMLCPQALLKERVLELLRRAGIPSDELLQEIPTGWERHGDLVLFPENAFLSPAFAALGDTLWTSIADALGNGCRRIAQKARIDPGPKRESRVRILFGREDDTWVEHVDNHITYGYDFTLCMFSIGNITEKLRVASLNCEDETVVDLYAGIGYFTLPYLVHAKARHLYACEWNANAVAALRRNLIRNKVADRCTVLEGDNRVVAPRLVADRVNLGLIPTSALGWPVAAACLKPVGGWMHVHENITTTLHGAENERQEWRAAGETIATSIRACLVEVHGGSWTVHIRHIECVKSYAPRIYHLVYDMECRPAGE